MPPFRKIMTCSCCKLGQNRRTPFLISRLWIYHSTNTDRPDFVHLCVFTRNSHYNAGFKINGWSHSLIRKCLRHKVREENPEESWPKTSRNQDCWYFVHVDGGVNCDKQFVYNRMGPPWGNIFLVYNVNNYWFWWLRSLQIAKGKRDNGK